MKHPVWRKLVFPLIAALLALLFVKSPVIKTADRRKGGKEPHLDARKSKEIFIHQRKIKGNRVICHKISGIQLLIDPKVRHNAE